MVLIRKMRSEDVEEASKVLCDVIRDSWERYEKGYYPKRALKFDVSVNSPERLREKPASPQKLLFVAQKNKTIVGIAFGEINPIVVEVMKEKGIDISWNKPKLINMKMVEDAELVITMGCGAQDVCPAPLKKEVIDWQLEDPKGKTIEEIRKIRDRIERKILKLIAQF